VRVRTWHLVFAYNVVYAGIMRMSRHFEEDVVGTNRRAGREGITYEMCVRIVEERAYSEEGGEHIFWGRVPELPGGTKWLKVVTNAEEDLLVTAYKDRGFARKAKRDVVGEGEV
jgi:hypothetical protein